MVDRTVDIGGPDDKSERRDLARSLIVRQAEWARTAGRASVDGLDLRCGRLLIASELYSKALVLAEVEVACCAARLDALGVEGDADAGLPCS